MILKPVLNALKESQLISMTNKGVQDSFRNTENSPKLRPKKLNQSQDLIKNGPLLNGQSSGLISLDFKETAKSTLDPPK